MEKTIRRKTATIARQIREELMDHPVARLGTIDELSRRFKVSRVTVHRAVRLLCDKGVLEAKPGQGILVAGAAQPIAQSNPSRLMEGHLRQRCRDASDRYLPSIAQLREYYHVSKAEIRDVIARLRKECLVSEGRGRRFMVARLPASADVNTGVASFSPEEALYQRIRARIESGDYQTGQPLPKFGYLASTEKTSTRVIVRVCRRLAHDGLAYRQGRQLIIGPAQNAERMGTQHRRKCILIVQSAEATWDAFTMTWWTQPFARSFMREMSLYGVEPRIVIYPQARGQSLPTGVCSGQDGVSRLVDQLGDRLLGILVMNMGWTDQDAVRMKEVLSAARRLCGFGKPVVSFDHLAKAHVDFSAPEQQRAIETEIAHTDMRRCFYRVHYDFLDSITLALSILHQHGHRVVAFPSLNRTQSWISFRLEYLRYCVAKARTPLQILDAHDWPPLFDPLAETRLEEVAAVLDRIAAPFARNMVPVIRAMEGQCENFGSLAPDQKELVELTAHLGAFLLNHDLTAIIAPNDEFARMFYRWFLVAGIRIPEDISLLSFDDRVESSYPYTISSINFGFDSLGFTAFHVILGDVSVKVDAWRSVAAKSRINHYATLGRARDESSKTMRK